MALDQAGLDQQLEMAGDARLRLAENGDEFGDRQFGLGEQGQKAQPRWLSPRRQAPRARNSKASRLGLAMALTVTDDIKISLYCKVKTYHHRGLARRTAVLFSARMYSAAVQFHAPIRIGVMQRNMF